MFGILLCATLMLAAVPALAADESMDLTLDGAFVQGGFIIGKTQPGATVTFAEFSTTAADDGTFVFGIPRMFDDVAEVQATLPSGEVLKTVRLIASQDYHTQHVRGVRKRHVNPDPADMERISADNAAIKAARAQFASLPYLRADFVLPVSGTQTGVYGSRRLYNGEERNWHKGMDIAAPIGTPIVAPAPGVVRLALAESFFNGNLVILDHGHQFMTIYAHLDTMAVREGQQLAAGDPLGTVGMTGRATGPHLHWGLYWRNMALDPKFLLKPTVVEN